MLDHFFPFIEPIEPVEEALFPFIGHISPFFDHSNRVALPLDWQIGFKLIGAQGREQFSERVQLMRLKHRLE